MSKKTTHTKSAYANEMAAIRKRAERLYKTGLKNADVHVRIPRNLTRKKILAIKPESIEDNLWQGSVYHVVHSIISKSLMKKFKTSRKKMVALNFDNLRKVIGSHTKVTLDALKDGGIIETDGIYIAGAVSRGYKLAAEYRKSALKFVTISNPDIKRRKTKFAREQYLKQKKLISKYAYLVKWFLDGTLKIDTEKAEKYLEAYKSRMFRLIDASDLSEEQKKNAKPHILNTVDSAKHLLKNWETSLPSFSLKGGRMFSCLTGIISQLRNYATHNGEELVYFDIKNSQPFHLLHLLQPSTWKEGKHKDITINNINKHTYQLLITDHKENYLSTIMALEQRKKEGKTLVSKGTRRDLSVAPTYGHLVAIGKLYKFIWENFKGKFVKKSGVDPFIDEKSTKKALIQMFYSNDREKHSPSKEYFEAFQKLFPVEAKIMETLKSNRYQDFSTILQQIESRMLLEKVCGTISKHDSNIPLYTIHDGIMTTKEHAEYVKKTILNTYKEIMGIEPELTTETMLPENAMGENFDKYCERKARELFHDVKSKKSYKETPELYLENIKDVMTSGLLKQEEKPLPDFFVDYNIMPWEKKS